MVERLRIERIGDQFHLVGELDLREAEEVRKAFASFDGRDVVVDLAALSFLDSSGCHELLDQKAKHPGLRFVSPSERVLRVTDILGVSDLLFGD